MTKRKVTDLLPSEAILISSDADLKVLEEFEKVGAMWNNGQFPTEWNPEIPCVLTRFNQDGKLGVFWESVDGAMRDNLTTYPATDFIPTEAEKVEDIEQIIREVSSGFNGQSVLYDLMSIGNMKNKDGMSVVKYFDKPNGGSVAYIRHDALVKHLNELVKQFKTRNPETK